MTPRQTLESKYRVGKPVNFEALVSVLTAITEEPNEARNYYLQRTKLSERTYHRCLDTLSELGLINYGPCLTSGSNRKIPLPDIFYKGFITDYPATNIAYFLNTFKMDEVPPGWEYSVAEFGDLLTDFFQQTPDETLILFSVLQDILALLSIASKNYTLFKKPIMEPKTYDQPTREIFSTLHSIISCFPSN